MKKLFERFRMFGCNPKATPLDADLNHDLSLFCLSQVLVS